MDFYDDRLVALKCISIKKSHLNDDFISKKEKIKSWDK